MSEPRMLSDEEFASYVADLKRQGFYHFPDRLIADRKARKEELARYKEIARAAREFDRKWFAAEVAASAINALHSALSRLPEPIGGRAGVHHLPNDLDYTARHRPDGGRGRS